MAEPFIGEIRMFPFGFAPRGWAECNGQILSIQTNQALFAIIGTTYGGDGRTNFALPDLRGRVPVHPGNEIAFGQRGGEQNHTLSQNEMPAHTHQAMAYSAASTSNQPEGNAWAQTLSGSYTESADTTMSAGALVTAGNGQPHENMQPYNVVTFCIAISGIFPSRN